MVSVKHCVLIFTLSLCISSSLVDCRRHKKSKRRDSRVRGRSSSRYRYGGDRSMRSSLDDCVDCGDRYEYEDEYYAEPYRDRRRKSKIRRPQKEASKKSEAQKESSYSFWSLFDSLKGALWSADENDDKSEEETKIVKEIKNRYRGGRRRGRGRRWRGNSIKSSRRRGDYSDSRYTNGRRKTKLKISEKRPYETEDSLKSRKYNDLTSQRGRNRNRNEQREYMGRKGRRGRYYQENEDNPRRRGRGKNSKRITHGNSKGWKADVESDEELDVPDYYVTKRRHRGGGRGRSHEPEDIHPRKNERSKSHKNNRKQKRNRKKTPSRDVDSSGQEDKETAGGQSHNKKDDDKLVIGEILKINEVSWKQRMRNRKKQMKPKIDNNKKSERLLEHVEDPVEVKTKKKPRKGRRKGQKVKEDRNIQERRRKISDGKAIDENTKKKKMSSARRRKLKKDQELSRRGNKESEHKNENKDQELSRRGNKESEHKNENKDQEFSRRGNKESEHKNENKDQEFSRRGNKESEHKNENNSSLGDKSTMRDKKKRRGKGNTKQKKKTSKVFDKETISDSTNRAQIKPLDKSDKSEKRKLDLEGKGSSRSRKTTKRGRKVSVAKSDGNKPSDNASTVSDSFKKRGRKVSVAKSDGNKPSDNASTASDSPKKRGRKVSVAKSDGKKPSDNASTASDSSKKRGRKVSVAKSDGKKPSDNASTASDSPKNAHRLNKPSRKSEAEKQVDALTDEQIIYALKVAEKRFKRTDRKIKKRLDNLKEMTLQHLDAIESLQRSLDNQLLADDFPVVNLESSNSTAHANNRISGPLNKDKISSTQKAMYLNSKDKSSLFKKMDHPSNKAKAVMEEDILPVQKSKKKKKKKKTKKMSESKKRKGSSNTKLRKDSLTKTSKKGRKTINSKKNPLVANSNLDSMKKNSKKDSSSTRKVASVGQKKSSSNSKKSSQISERKRKRKKGKKKVSTQKENNGNIEPILKNIFEGIKDEKINRHQKQKSSSNSKKSSQISKRKRKRKKGKKKISTQKENKGNTEPILKNIFEGIKDEKTNRHQKQKKLRKRIENRKSKERQNDGLNSQFMAKSRQRGKNPGHSESFLARYKLRQRSLPRLRRTVMDASRRLYRLLKPFNENIRLRDSEFNMIFNVTRYVIIDGARDIIKTVNAANDDVYQAVMESSQLGRSIYLRARRGREAQRAHMVSEEAVQKALQSRIEMKDFRPHMRRVQEQQNRLQSGHRERDMLGIKTRQMKSRVIQIRGEFTERYDRKTYISLNSDLRSTIDILNNGLTVSYPLRELHRSKRTVKFLRRNVKAAQEIVKNSSLMYSSGYGNYQECRKLVSNVKRSRRELGRKRLPADSPGPGLTSRQYEDLKDLARKARQHAQHLQELKSDAHRVLTPSIRSAKIAMEKIGKKRGGGKINVPKISLVDFNTTVREAVISLDELRQHIGGKTKITLQRLKGCEKTLEGPTDDEDLGCDLEGSGVEGSGDMTFVENDDDFTFEEVPPVNSKVNLLQQFGNELQVFTSRILNQSQKQFNESQVIIISLRDLKEEWNTIERNASPTQAKLRAKEYISNRLAAVKSNSTGMRETIQKVNETLSKLKGIDFERLHDIAATARKSAKEKMNSTDDGVDDKEIEESTDSDLSEFENLVEKEKSITSNREEIKNLQTLAVNTIEKTNTRLSAVRGNITKLWQKIKLAKNILSTMQFSILKEGDSPILSTALSDDLTLTKSIITSLNLCIKPQNLDGTVLYSKGNNSISYTLELDSGYVTAHVYDESSDELKELQLEKPIEKDEWYHISLLRVGQKINLKVTKGNFTLSEKSVKVLNMPNRQITPYTSYIGGVPEDEDVGEGNSWEGCVSELMVNNRAMNLFNPAIDGTSTRLCSNHCVTGREKLSWIFDGGGFVHYDWDPRQSIQSLTLQFRSRQLHAAIMSVAHKRSDFNLLVKLDKGAIRIESVSRRKNMVQLSLNDSFNDGNIHILKITIENERIYPELDGIKTAFSVENSRSTLPNDIKNGIFLGAFVSNKELLGNIHSPLIGCARIQLVNEKPLMFDAVLQSHNVFYGKCTMRSVLQSCVHFSNASQPLSLGDIHDSNQISMLVLRNSTGPLISYKRTDGNIEIEISMTEDGIHIDALISGDESKAELIRSEKYEENIIDFDFITVEDYGKKITVRAYDESTEITYLGFWYSAADLSFPHTIELGQTRGVPERRLDLSISQLIIGERMFDLREHYNSTFDACNLPRMPSMRQFTPDKMENTLEL